MTTYNGTNKEIVYDKVSVLTLFKDFWFRIPSYQRPYVWGDEQIDELFEDLRYAMENAPGKEYFLGSAVLQKNTVTEGGITFTCHHLLDGQQRLTTLFLLMATLRDLAQDELLRKKADEAIWRPADPFENHPERTRIDFEIRDEVAQFIDERIKPSGATNGGAIFDHLSKSSGSPSVVNMAKAVLCLKGHLQDLAQDALKSFAMFLFQRVVFIYVSTEELEDAFRLFQILNDRGIPLSTSDVLKSMNIGEVASAEKKRIYAREWEEMESYFGRDDFDRFLNHARTVLLKDKPRESLLKEWERIYKERLLIKGPQTLDLLRSYRDHYARLIELESTSLPLRTANLIAVMKVGLATDWIPPLLCYYQKFHDAKLHEFVEKLESKFAADWILRLSPGQRLANTYAIVRAVEKATGPEDLVQSPDLFAYARDELRQRISGDVYQERFVRHLLLKVEYLLQSAQQRFPHFHRVTIEHVLPQNPSQDSPWFEKFEEAQRTEWTHRLANLVLLGRNKNASLGNSSFEDKKTRYFQSSVEVFPAIGRVLQLPDWTPEVLKTRQDDMLDMLMKGFK